MYMLILYTVYHVFIRTAWSILFPDTFRRKLYNVVLNNEL